MGATLAVIQAGRLPGRDIWTCAMQRPLVHLPGRSPSEMATLNGIRSTVKGQFPKFLRYKGLSTGQQAFLVLLLAFHEEGLCNCWKTSCLLLAPVWGLEEARNLLLEVLSQLTAWT